MRPAVSPKRLGVLAAVAAVAVSIGEAAGEVQRAHVHGCAPPPHDVPPTEVVADATGEIAFASTRNGASDVYVVDSGGRDEHAVTRNRPVPIAVDWAPDCRFALSSADASTGASHVWVASADTRDLRRIGPGGEPSWSPDSSLIAFTWSIDLDVEDRRNGVYLAAPDGSRRRQVARTHGAPGKPAWSPDGGSLAFSDEATIRRLDLRTGAQTEILVHRETSPPDVAWSPDGETLAFVADGDIRTVAPTGGVVRRLTTTADDAEDGLAWQPDGTLTFLGNDDATNGYVAYAIELDALAGPTPRRLFTVDADWPPRFEWSSDGAHVLLSSQFGPRAWILRADGSSRRQLLHGEGHAGPSWSPDGRRLAIATAAPTGSILGGAPLALLTGRELTSFARTRCAPPLSWAPDGRRLTCDATEGGDIALVAFTADGGATSRLVLSDRGIGDPTKTMADWEPNGRRLVYVESDLGRLALHRVGAPAPRRGPARDVIPIKGLTAAPESPAWSPAGRRIAFSGSCENAGRRCRAGIYVVRVDGKQLKRVASAGRNPDWSPDGKQIVFDATRSGNRDLYVVNANGTGLRRLTTSPGGDFDPSWRPRR